MKAQQHLEWVQKQVSKEDLLKAFMTQLEAAAPGNLQEESLNEKTDKL